MFSDNPMWESFGLRSLECAAYGGADTGECLSTLARVADGTAEDWYREWTQTAERAFAAGVAREEAGHIATAREAYLHASSYCHISYLPLFGAPVDPWLVDAFERETEAFCRGARLSEFPIEPVEVPFEGSALPGYFVQPCEDLQSRPVILHVTGYDSNIQEMYFAHGAAALRRGYNVLLLDGPGQGRALIRDKMPLRPDWETVAIAAVDFLLTRPEVDPARIVLAGCGLGGYLASRAAAFEKRIAALIADAALWDQRQTLSKLHLPPDVLLNFPDIPRAVFDAIEEHLQSPETNSMVRWKVLQRDMWAHGVSSLYDLVFELCRYEMSGAASKLSCPALTTVLDGGPLSIQADMVYEELTCPTRLVRLSGAEGAGHFERLDCRLYTQRVFDWLDAMLGRWPPSIVDVTPEL